MHHQKSPESSTISSRNNYLPGLFKSLQLNRVGKITSGLKSGSFADGERARTTIDTSQTLAAMHVEVWEKLSHGEDHHTVIEVSYSEDIFLPPLITATRNVYIGEELDSTSTYNPKPGSNNSLPLHSVASSLKVARQLSEAAETVG